MLSEAVAFVSGDKNSVFLCVSVAAASVGATVASCLVAEACSALLAVKFPSQPAAASNLTVSSSAALQPGAYLISAVMSGEHEVRAKIQAGADAVDSSHALCQATMSYAE